MTKNIFMIMMLTMGFAAPVYAYIDPVTGSVIVQSIIAGIAVVLVAMRRLRERIVNFFRRKPDTGDEQQDPPQP
jgi:hypothetical protein